jgi:hypothetical protein
VDQNTEGGEETNMTPCKCKVRTGWPGGWSAKRKQRLSAAREYAIVDQGTPHLNQFEKTMLHER